MTGSERSVFGGEQDAFDYDQVVDWDKRLAREAPFFRSLFEESGVGRVVDVGCGTGMHDVLFASWGLEVIGIDPSEEMLDRAREHAQRAGAEIAFAIGEYGQLGQVVGETADAVVSLGNAFMHADRTDGGARAALSDMAAILRPGGLLVLHFLNYDRLLSQRPRLMSSRFRETADGDKVFLKLLDYSEGNVDFTMITLSRPPGSEWQFSSRMSSHVPLPTAEVVSALLDVGFEEPQLYGSHERAPFAADSDESVIMVTRKT